MIRRTVQEVLWCIVAMVLLILAVLVISSCSMDRDKWNSRADCEMTTPEGVIMRCNTQDKAESKEGELLTNPPL